MHLKLHCTLLMLGVMSAVAEQHELIMLEIQPIIYEKTLVKRSPITQQSQEPQYIQQQSGAEVPPEYFSFLQQLQLQQPGLVQQQPDPNNIQQVLVSRTPQTFTGQPPRPPPRRLTPEQEQQRRLQENIQQKSIREQEVRDAQRQQQAQLQRLYQQQAGPAVDPLYLAQLQSAQQQFIQLPQDTARQVIQLQDPRTSEQYVSLAGQQQYVQAASQQQEPERVSYSQVQFGSTKLPKRLTTVGQQQPQELVYAQPQPQQQQVLLQPKSAQLVYTSQSGQDIVYNPQRSSGSSRGGSSSSSSAGPPQQYLIETTKVEQPVHQQKPQVYYRPQANYQDLQSSILAQQQQAQYLQQQIEVATTAIPPSRSSIFVSTARTPVELKPTQLSEIRIPKQDSQRPLSQNEFNALINAGFKAPSSDATPVYSQSYQPQFTYYREIGKRQNKPVPKRVQLTVDERRALAKEGIRNLYRIEGTDTNESPITYVLAVSARKDKQN